MGGWPSFPAYMSYILSQPSPITAAVLIFLCIRRPCQSQENEIISLTAGIIYIMLIFLVNVGFTAFTLVPMWCRALGYNMCMRSLATRESHRQALREILPLFILKIPSLLATLCLIIVLTLQKQLQTDGIINGKWSFNVLLLTVGPVIPLSFTFHLCVLGKTKLKSYEARRYHCNLH